MNDCQRVRPDLGAFALGALNDDEAAKVREHLDTCVDCARELSELSRAVDALALVDIDTVESPATPAPSSEFLPSLLERVRAERRRAGRRRILLAAVAAAVITVLAGLGGLLLSTPESTGPDVAAPEPPVASSSGSSDGIGLAVRAWDRDWGTAVEASVSGVPGGARCSLVAVGQDGTREVAATWLVPVQGYEGGSLSVDGGVGLHSDEVERYEVVTVEGTLLVSTG